MRTEPPRECAWRTAVLTGGRDDAPRLFDRVHGGTVTIDDTGAQCSLDHTRFAAPDFAIEELCTKGPVHVELRPSSEIVVVHSDSGLHVEDVGGEADVPPGELVLAQPGEARMLRAEAGQLRLTSMSVTLLRRVADGDRGTAPGPVHFIGTQAATAGLSDTWKVCGHGVTQMLHGEGATAALVVDACATLLAVATLVCFPNTAVREPADGIDSEAPEQLRRAMAFLRDNARDDVGVRELADAMHLTPRAVQYLFRKCLYLTPTEYLRGVRLHGAREDLLAADCATSTVAQIAAQWRFAHTGRFAAFYRQAYGQSPRSSLQQRL